MEKVRGFREMRNLRNLASAAQPLISASVQLIVGDKPCLQSLLVPKVRLPRETGTRNKWAQLEKVKEVGNDYAPWLAGCSSPRAGAN